MWNKIKEFFSSASYKRTLGIIFVLILVLAVPVTLNLIKQRQELRQRAGCDTDTLECGTTGTITFTTKKTQICNSTDECNNLNKNHTVTYNSTLTIITLDPNTAQPLTNIINCSTDCSSEEKENNCNNTNCSTKVSGTATWTETTSNSCNSISGCSCSTNLPTDQTCSVTTLPSDCPTSCPSGNAGTSGWKIQDNKCIQDPSGTLSNSSCDAGFKQFLIISNNTCINTQNYWKDVDSCSNSGDGVKCYDPNTNDCKNALGGGTSINCTSSSDVGQICSSPAGTTCYDVNGTFKCIDTSKNSVCFKCKLNNTYIQYVGAEGDCNNPIVIPSGPDAGKAWGNPTPLSCPAGSACTAEITTKDKSQICSESTGGGGTTCNPACSSGQICQNVNDKMTCVTSSTGGATSTCTNGASCTTSDNKTGTCQSNQCIANATGGGPTAATVTCNSMNDITLPGGPAKPCQTAGTFCYNVNGSFQCKKPSDFQTENTGRCALVPPETGKLGEKVSNFSYINDNKVAAVDAQGLGLLIKSDGTTQPANYQSCSNGQICPAGENNCRAYCSDFAKDNGQACKTANGTDGKCQVDPNNANALTCSTSNIEYLALKIKLPGIGGKNPDNTFIPGDNLTPRNLTRTVNLYFYNPSNAGSNVSALKTVNATLTFDATDGTFVNSTIDLANQVAPGTYILKVKLSNTVLKRFPSNITLAAGQTADAGLLSFATKNGNVTGSDFNNDNSLDVGDYTQLISCISSNRSASCTDDIFNEADLNNDGIVDQRDVNILLRGFDNREGD